MNTNSEEKDLLKKQAATANAETAAETTVSRPSFEYKPYMESDAVKQAQSMLQQQMSNKPGQYTSPWQTQLNDTINKILNREKFSYDLNGDALYQQYKDQYTTQGKMAMMDTMGQAAALTGGYGNSYAQSVGQQAYQGYLQQLNDKIPELYQLALSKYQMEGDDLRNQYAVLGDRENQDYGRYRDTVSDYNIELDRLQSQYDKERDYDYSKWADNRDFSYNQFSDDRAYDYQVGRDKVADEQWQKEFDEAVRQFNFENKLGEFAKKSSSGGGGSSGGSGGSGGSWLNGDGTVNVNKINTNTDWWKDYAATNGLDPATGQKKSGNGGGGGGGGSTDGFSGNTYSEAVAYMKNNGVSGASASGIKTESEFKRSSSSKEYNSYKEYLQYSVDKKIATK